MGELYATDQYTLESLRDELTDLGLRTRKGRYPERAVSTSKLQSMLRDPYYTGIVTYKDEIFQGRHEPLVSQESFDIVQGVLDAKACAGERERRHDHYLKGTIWCGYCHEQGRESRMLMQRAVGKSGGEYWYFFCAARSECARGEARYIGTDDVEDEIEKRYRTFAFAPGFVSVVRAKIREALDDRIQAEIEIRKRAEAAIAVLDEQEENLVGLAADGTLPQAKIRARLRKIQNERDALIEQMSRGVDRVEDGAAALEAALELLRHPEVLYRESGPKFRRLINQAVFEKMYVTELEVTDVLFREPFEELHQAQRAFVGGVPTLGSRQRPVKPSGTKAALLDAIHVDVGLSKTAVVELMSCLSHPPVPLATLLSDAGPSGR